jgi:hypothetical protein
MHEQNNLILEKQWATDNSFTIQLENKEAFTVWFLVQSFTLQLLWLR